MKKINNTVRNTVTKKVNDMTVAEMRDLAKQLGIKNAKKHKRAELSVMLIDELCKLEQPSSGSGKRAKGSNKSVELDVEEVEAFLDKASNGEAGSREYAISVLMAYGRQVLIRVMKACKVKGWYRIYDKTTMVDRIMEASGVC